VYQPDCADRAGRCEDCSKACREKARRDAKRHEIDCHALDTGPPENVTTSVQETQQNQGSKTGPQKPQGFSDAAQARGCTNLIAPTARVRTVGFVGNLGGEHMDTPTHINGSSAELGINYSALEPCVRSEGTSKSISGFKTAKSLLPLASTRRVVRGRTTFKPPSKSGCLPLNKLRGGAFCLVAKVMPLVLR